MPEVQSALVKKLERHLAIYSYVCGVTRRPRCERHTVIKRHGQTPPVAAQRVERLVVEGRHELCVGRRSVGAAHAERPFLFLSRGEPVAEGSPLHHKPRVLLRAGQRHGMAVKPAVLHPRIVEQHTVAILRLVGKLARVQLVAKCHRAVLEYPVASQHCVEHMQQTV